MADELLAAGSGRRVSAGGERKTYRIGKNTWYRPGSCLLCSLGTANTVLQGSPIILSVLRKRNNGVLVVPHPLPREPPTTSSHPFKNTDMAPGTTLALPTRNTKMLTLGRLLFSAASVVA